MATITACTTFAGPFTVSPDFGASSVNYGMGELVARAEGSPMKPLFTVHEGEFLVGDYINRRFGPEV